MILYNDIPEEMKGKTLMITGGDIIFGKQIVSNFFICSKLSTL